MSIVLRVITIKRGGGIETGVLSEIATRGIVISVLCEIAIKGGDRDTSFK